MSNIKAILCPVDFSEPSDKALAFALELAAKFEARVELVHVYQLPVYALPDGAMMAGEEFTVRVTTELQKALNELKEKHPDAKIDTHLVEGIPYKEIVRVGEELGCSMIVMGTHGRTGLKHLLMGSVAERVVRSAKVPVVSVPT